MTNPTLLLSTSHKYSLFKYNELELTFKPFYCLYKNELNSLPFIPQTHFSFDVRRKSLQSFKNKFLIRCLEIILHYSEL